MLTTKQYLQKFNLDSDNFKRDAFLNELTKEFKERIETTKVTRERSGLPFEFSNFQHQVHEMQDKFNQISNRRNNVGFNETLFSAFFAKAVIPLRETMFPKEHQRLTELREKKLAITSKQD